MMDRMLKEAEKQSDSAEIMYVGKENSPLNFYNWRGIDTLSRNVKEISVRIIRNGRLGSACGSFTQDSDRLIKDAVKAAEAGPQVKFDFPSSSDRPAHAAKITDEKLLNLTTEDMVRDGREIYDYIKTKIDDLGLNLYFNNEKKSVHIMNSNGKNDRYTMTVYSIGLLSMYEGSKEGINKEISSCRYFKFPREKMDELVNENKHSRKIFKAPTRKMPVVFRASSTWSLFYRILEGVNGHNYVRGITPLKEKIDQRIIGENLTLTDDPTMDYAPGSTPFDDEGVPVKKKKIIENGILKNFIFDLDSGARSGFGSSGNGIKATFWGSGIEIPPSPRFNNLVMSPGTWTLGQMIQDMEEGLLINDVVGFHSGNMLQGQYSMSVGMGFYVKNGKVQGRVMDAMTAGNIYDDFFRIKALGNKLEKNNLLFSPDLYITDVSVSSE